MHRRRSMGHPVTFTVEHAEKAERVHVVIRLVLLIALGAVGCSSLYWMLYLVLPALAALLIAQAGAERYLAEDAPRAARVLDWLAGAYAYLWLLTDELPAREAPRPTTLQIAPGGAPTVGSAILRLLTSVPALLVLLLLSMVAAFLWLVGALFILVARRLPASIHDFLALTLRYQFRLAAYHLSLVDRYPSFEASPLGHGEPHAGAA